MKGSPQRTGHPYRFVFVVVSVLAHLLALAVLWSLSEPADRGSPSEPIFEVELTSPPLRPQPTLKPVTPTKTARIPRQRRTKGPAPTEVTSPTMSLAMRAATLVRGRPRKPDLSLVRDRFLAEVSPPTGRQEQSEREPEAARVKRRLDQVLAREAARRNVTLGRVHPVLYDVMRDSEKGFSPSWGLTSGDPHQIGTVGSTSKALVRALGREYLRTLERHRAAHRRAPGLDHDDGPSFAEVLNNALHSGSVARDTGLSTELCVELARGRKIRVTVAHSSGRRDFDRLGRGALLRAARIRQATPGYRAVTACYSFSASFYRIPPMPILCGSFDEVELSLEVYYPLKKLIRTRVKLLSARYL